jgi:hypothetical protein
LGKQFSHCLYAAKNILGVLAADADAVAAADASLGDDLRLAIGDPNSLRGAFAHARVADAAALFDRPDQLDVIWSAHLILIDLFDLFLRFAIQTNLIADCGLRIAD